MGQTSSKYARLPSDSESISPLDFDDPNRVISREQTSSRLVSTIRGIAVVGWLGVLVLLLTGRYFQDLTTKTDMCNCESTWPTAFNTESFFPPFRTKPTIYKENKRFMDTGIPGDNAWADLIPLGGGFLSVPNPQLHGLTPSMPVNSNDPNGAQIYGTAVVHQLHCLGMLRTAFIGVLNGTEIPNRPTHLFHCFDYIRQALLCYGDTTMEHAEKIDPNHPLANAQGWTFNGGGTTHQCADWEGIKRFLVDHRLNDQTTVSGHGEIEI